MAELAEKIDALIVAIGGLSYDKIAQEIKAGGGPTVSGAYLWQLRSGARDNPTFHHLQALSAYFSRRLSLPITLSYFDPDTPVDQPWRDAQDEDRVAHLTKQLDEERELTVRLADHGVRRLATRYGEMGPGLQRQVIAIIDALSAQEKHEGEPAGEQKPV